MSKLFEDSLGPWEYVLSLLLVVALIWLLVRRMGYDVNDIKNVSSGLMQGFSPFTYQRNDGGGLSDWSRALNN